MAQTAIVNRGFGICGFEQPRFWFFFTPKKAMNSTMKLGYNELGYNEYSVIANTRLHRILGYNEYQVLTNNFLSQKGHFSTQINPLITNRGNNEQKWPVPGCSL